jgi:ABC-type lipoprotein export system ATPase subunit
MIRDSRDIRAPGRAAADATIVRCDRLTVAYGSVPARVLALDRVDLVLDVGETVALWGPSGSGKTTLLHALGGLVEPYEGRVLWRGTPLSTIDAAARARVRSYDIGYVFQGSNLLPVFTAYENVAFAAFVSDRGGDAGTSVEARATEMLTLVGLAAKAEHLPSELSGGEAQRVAIARALAQQPVLLLCDEPTGHLDTDTTARVLDLLDALQERFGFTLVVATHDADVAARFSRVVELMDGRLIAEHA